MSAADRLRLWVPRWWRGEVGAAGTALALATAPAEVGFRAVAGTRSVLYDAGFLKVERAPIPIVSVGNISVGGTGKTPVTALFADRIGGWERRPAVLVRGYGADEIAVHEELNPSVPVFAAARRIEAARAAAAAGCDCAILDDGFQHRALHRDLDVVVVAAESWEGPRRLLPRGPWREPVSALGRADFALVTRKSAPTERARRVAAEIADRFTAVRTGVAHLSGTRFLPLGAPAEAPVDVAGMDLLAVTSLADPGPFLDHLNRMGATAEHLAFPDHHDFASDDIEAIVGKANGRTIVMTRKEAVKLRTDLGGVPALMLEQEVHLEAGEAELEMALREALGGGG